MVEEPIQLNTEVQFIVFDDNSANDRSVMSNMEILTTKRRVEGSGVLIIL